MTCPGRSAYEFEARGGRNIGVFRSGGFRAKGGFRAEKGSFPCSLAGVFFLCQVCSVCVFLFVFHKVVIFFSEIWFILKKTLGILCEHH